MAKPKLTLAAPSSRGVNPSGSGGNGRGNLSERVAVLETELKHLVTKAWILLIAFGIVSSVGAGVWYLSGRLATIETRLIAVEASFDSYKESHDRKHDREDSQ